VTSIGAKWIREELSGLNDNLFLSAAQKGITILPIIEPSGAWTMPSDPSAFAATTAQLVARYGSGGTLWQEHPELAKYAPTYFEIWNEPWYSVFSTPVDPARYARLFKAAVVAGRKANPAARFIIAAEWQYSIDGNSWHNWINDMYAAVPDLNSYMDAYSVHPYGNGSADNWTPGNGDAFETRRLEVIHDAFVSHGAADKKMWVTEVGWSTCSTSVCYSEADQAANYARFNQLARSSWAPYMAAVFYYALSDGWQATDRTNKELWFGAIRPDGSHKPAYDVLKAAFGS